MHHEKKLSGVWINIVLLTALMTLVFSFLPLNEETIMAANINAVANVVSYLKIIFHLRYCLESILSKDRATRLFLSGPLTLIFTVVYLQYKINQRADEYDNESTSK